MNGRTGQKPIDKRFTQIGGNETELKKEHENLNNADPESIGHNDHYLSSHSIFAQELTRVDSLGRGVVSDWRYIRGLEFSQHVAYHEREDGYCAHGKMS